MGTFGFKGKPSLSYFNAASTAGKWVFRDTEGGVDREQSNMVVTFESVPSEYTYVLPFYDPDYTNQLNINTLDQDIKFKQYPYGQILVVSSTALTTSNVLLRTATGSFIDAEHVTVTNTSGNTYKIVFWTHAVAVNDLIDVFIGAPAGLSDIANFSVRVTASFELATLATQTDITYKTLAAHVYDDYYTTAGYKDNTKVKLFAGNTNGNPYEVFTITSGNKMVTETISSNPASSVVSKATESVRRPPASPEVTLIQPTQSISANVESRQAADESQNTETAVTKAIDQIQVMMDLRNRSVSFTRDQETGTDIIKVIDDNTGDTIRQMPSEELLTFMKNLTQMFGIFIDEKAQETLNLDLKTVLLSN